MLSYIEGNSFLHRRNPTVKFAIMIILTVIICLSYYPILPIFTFAAIFLLTVFAGGISWRVFAGQIKAFIIIAMAYMISMGLLRGISYSENAV